MALLCAAASAYEGGGETGGFVPTTAACCSEFAIHLVCELLTPSHKNLSCLDEEVEVWKRYSK